MHRMSSFSYDIVIVGAGLSGATIAEQLHSKGYKVLILEKRDNIGGNVYDEIDTQTGIRINKYGAHLFHTNDEEIWNYVNSFTDWIRWDHTVLADISGGLLVPIPANQTTINRLFGLHLQGEEEVKAWLDNERIPCETPTNSRDVALARVGPRLYSLLFESYTKKQWDKFPEELAPSVLERIPVRTNTDTRYFSDRFQGLPMKGYTHLVEKMLEGVEVRLGVSWCPEKHACLAPKVIFTGPIDQYFSDAGLPPLEYRSLQFHWERIPMKGYMQPNSVVNYTHANTPLTRTVEYKHFYNQQSDWTICCHETSCEKGEPYYPVPTKENQELYQQYAKLAKEEEKKGVYFVGRLATYKYYNMDQAIRAALNLSNEILLETR